MFARCARCGARKTLHRKPENYLRLPACPNPACARRTKQAGERTKWREDKYRAKFERGRKAACRDPACMYHFPHRRGSLRCIHHPRFYEFEEELWQSHTTCLA